MWPGVAAGLALLTWFIIVFPTAFAVQTTLDDQLLTFNGLGWEDTESPQICRQVSTSMRSTSTSGDSVDFTFSGTGVIVWGPVTGNSSAVVVILDGVIQPLVVPQECTGGCGIIYASGVLTDTSHNITVLFPQADGTSTLSICGITVTTYMPQFIQNPSPTQTQGITGTTAIPPTSSMTLEPSPPPVATTAFITTRGMIIAIVGSIVGIIAAMSLLLFIFITVRGRVTRRAARSRDREKTRDQARDQGPQDTLSALSSVYLDDGKSNVASALIESGPSGIRASITVSIISTHSPISLHRASGLGRSRTQSSGMPSIHTERDMAQNLGLVPGSPTETDTVSIASLQTEENPLVSHRSSRTMSRLSIPITLFSPRRRLSSTNPPASTSSASTTPRDSRTSDVFDLFPTPRASFIRIFSRKKHPPLESERGSGSSAAVNQNSRTHHTRHPFD